MRWVLVELCLSICVMGCSGSSGTPDAGRFPDARRPSDARVDAGLPDADYIDANIADAVPRVAGRVCVVIDLRLWENGCLSDNAQDLRVTLTSPGGTAMATTDAGGFFMVSPPQPPALVKVVRSTSPSDIVASLTVWSGTGEIQIPAPLTAYWDTVKMQSGIDTSAGNGSALVAFTLNGNPVMGATATSNPPMTSGAIHYDGASATSWDTDSTGARGMVLLGDLPAQRVTVTAIQGARVGDATVDVEAGSLTFATGVMQ